MDSRWSRGKNEAPDFTNHRVIPAMSAGPFPQAVNPKMSEACFKHQKVLGPWPLGDHSSASVQMNGGHFPKLYSSDQALSALNWSIREGGDYVYIYKMSATRLLGVIQLLCHIKLK